MQNSNVIRVNNDGSGEIWSRYYFAPQMVGMLGMMAGGMGELGADPSAGGASMPEMPDADSILKPTQESLTKGAASYGPEVRYQRHEMNKNAEGWDGYLVVYEFDDITKLKFDPNNPPGPLSELAKMDPDALAKASADVPEEAMMHFAMTDGVLTVNTGVTEETIAKIAEMGEGGPGGGGGIPGGPPEIDGGAAPVDGAGEAEVMNEAAMGMAAAMLQGMRMAFFLRIQPGIAETNASHVKGNFITLSDMKPAEMMTDPKFLEMAKKSEALKGQAPDEAAIKEMLESLKALEGVTIETQEKITVKFE